MQSAIKQLFHFTSFHFDNWLLLLYTFLYATMVCLIYGGALPSGLFIPSLLTGAGVCVRRACITVHGITALTVPAPSRTPSFHFAA